MVVRRLERVLKALRRTRQSHRVRQRIRIPSLYGAIRVDDGVAQRQHRRTEHHTQQTVRSGTGQRRRVGRRVVRQRDHVVDGVAHLGHIVTGLVGIDRRLEQLHRVIIRSLGGVAEQISLVVVDDRHRVRQRIGVAGLHGASHADRAGVATGQAGATITVVGAETGRNRNPSTVGRDIAEHGVADRFLV